MRDRNPSSRLAGSETPFDSRLPWTEKAPGNAPGRPVLVVVHHPADFHRLRMTLELQLDDRRIVHATTRARAVRKLQAEPFAAVLLDLELPDEQGIEVLESVVAAAPEVPVVVLSRAEEQLDAVGLLRAGAEDVLPMMFAEGPTLVRVIRYAIERRRTRAQLQRLSLFDPGTGLVNRGYFQLRLQELLRRTHTTGEQTCVLFFDVDDFQLVNDSLGPDAGDRALRIVSERFRDALGDGDTAVAARWGGDEFVGAITGVESPEAALEVGRRVLESIAQPLLLGADELYLTASVGVTLSQRGEIDATRPIREADLAMHDAKRDGHRTIRFFDESMDEVARQRLDLGRALRRAVEHGEFDLHYQPQVDALTGELDGVEALLRWPHGEPSLRSPAQFIPVLESTGLIHEVGAWVVQRALHDLKRWDAAGIAVPRVAVNASALQLRDRRLVRTIRHELVASGIAPERLEVEVTESVLLESRFPSGDILREIEATGVDIALDDFGTGYSSLSQLVRFPIQTLKIDRAFIRDMKRTPRHTALLSSILAMGERLGLRTLVEGVETEGELGEVVKLGARHVQGYVFARPMEAAAIEQWVRARRGSVGPDTPLVPRPASASSAWRSPEE